MGFVLVTIMEDLIFMMFGCKIDTIIICNALTIISYQLDEIKNGDK